MTETTDRSPLLGLLEPFPPEMVGKLPRVTCKDCSDFRKTCNDHKRQYCDICSSFISSKHTHLDYVGHADVTRRLLEIDPAWQWDPIAEDDNGLPIFDTDDTGNPVGLWIKLTVLGVTRRGYGSCPSRQNDAVKVLIGDALRNAAMRFGVALDLWAKGDRANPSAENATAAGGAASRTRSGGQRPVTTDRAWMAAMEKRIAESGSEQELQTIANELDAKRHAGFCEPADYERLWALGERRHQDLAAERDNVAEVPRSPEPVAAPSPPPAVAPVGPPPAGDAAAELEKRMEQATSTDELGKVKADVMAAFKAQRFDPTTGNALLKAIKEKTAELEADAA